MFILSLSRSDTVQSRKGEIPIPKGTIFEYCKHSHFPMLFPSSMLINHFSLAIGGDEVNIQKGKNEIYLR